MQTYNNGSQSIKMITTSHNWKNLAFLGMIMFQVLTCSFLGAMQESGSENDFPLRSTEEYFEIALKFEDRDNREVIRLPKRDFLALQASAQLNFLSEVAKEEFSRIATSFANYVIDRNTAELAIPSDHEALTTRANALRDAREVALYRHSESGSQRSWGILENLGCCAIGCSFAFQAALERSKAALQTDACNCMALGVCLCCLHYWANKARQEDKKIQTTLASAAWATHTKKVGAFVRDRVVAVLRSLEKHAFKVDLKIKEGDMGPESALDLSSFVETMKILRVTAMALDSNYFMHQPPRAISMTDSLD